MLREWSLVDDTKNDQALLCIVCYFHSILLLKLTQIKLNLSRWHIYKDIHHEKLLKNTINIIHTTMNTINRGGNIEYLTLRLSHFKKLTSHFIVILVHFLPYSVFILHIRDFFPMFHPLKFTNGLWHSSHFVTFNRIISQLQKFPVKMNNHKSASQHKITNY